jgi:glucan phosphoethanolaminetransferase (alkaline phosphatase superfamily)
VNNPEIWFEIWLNRIGGAVRNIIKITLILAAIVLRYPSIIDRFVYFGLTAKLALYLAMFTGSTALLIVTGWIANNRMRLFWALVLALAAAPIVSFEFAGGEPMGYFEFITLVDARGSFADALQMFPLSALAVAVSTLLLLVGIGLKPNRGATFIPKYALAAPILGTALMCSMLLARNGEGAAGLPPSWAGIGYSALYAKARLSGTVGARSFVAIKRTLKPLDRDIVFIIDESVAGHYLDINSPNGVNSGLKTPRDGISISNFGLASSIANCSMASNIMLRFGGTRDNYQQIVGTMPSIWSYAKAAGYRSNYLYAQAAGKSENYMTDEERKDIDNSITFEGIAVNDRDQAAAKRLVQIINDDKRDFVLLNKLGAHFPVNDRYPPAYAQYGPALPNALKMKPEDESEANFLQILGQNKDWRRYRNAYRNTITWTVGAFFKTLFDKADMQKATVIYTSDHGQTFHERGALGVTTHCRANAEVEELVVPLVIIDATANANPRFIEAAKRNHNASSHFRIFPSLLDMMGYDPAAVHKTYGKALDSASPDPMMYISEMYLWSDQKGQLRHANMAEVIHPPARDLIPD